MRGRSLIILSAVCLTVVAQQPQDINVLLQKDISFSGPAVFSRLTPDGVTYVSSFVAAAVAAELPISPSPEEPTVTKIASLPNMEMSRIHLREFALPPRFGVSPVEPDLVVVDLQNINASLTSRLKGSIDGNSLNEMVTVRTQNLRVQASIRIGRNTRGNAQLKVMACRVPSHLAVVVNSERQLSPIVGPRLADSFANDGHNLFESIICSRLKHIVDHRINQRFSLLATKISLGEIQRFDLVKSLLKAENRLRRRLKLNRQRRKFERKMARDFVSEEKSGTTSKSTLHMGAVERVHQKEEKNRVKRQEFRNFMKSFNLSRADYLELDFALAASPRVSARGIEISSSGEITAPRQRTPFGPAMLTLPAIPSANDMLQIAVSDFVPNSLMYHGHRTGLFNTRVDPSTPQFGPVMRTTCDLSTGSLFCVGDLFPTLRDAAPNRGIAFLFSTLRAPAVIVMPDGIKFQLIGLLELVAMDPEQPLGAMEIHIDAAMKMRLTSKHVRGKIILDDIRLISRSPAILVQEELDDASLLSRDILQKMVNDILKQGIPIPVHPLFRLQKPKLTLMERSMLLETSFQLNQNLIRQLTTETLKRAH